MIVVFHDVSERRRAAREREQMLKREQAARLAAESADRIKDEFLATVSHELRTPLTAILGWAAMLNLGPLEEETVRNALEVIERNAGRAQIIDDILVSAHHHGSCGSLAPRRPPRSSAPP